MAQRDKKKYKNNKDADRLVAEEIYRKLCPVAKCLVLSILRLK